MKWKNFRFMGVRSFFYSKKAFFEKFISIRNIFLFENFFCSKNFLLDNKKKSKTFFFFFFVEFWLGHISTWLRYVVDLYFGSTFQSQTFKYLLKWKNFGFIGVRSFFFIRKKKKLWESGVFFIRKNFFVWKFFCSKIFLFQKFYVWK